MRPFRTEMDSKPVVLACAHWRNFPPAKVQPGTTPEVQRRLGVYSEAEYQRAKVWERVCGQITMQRDKCLACQFCRTVDTSGHIPMLVSLDGKTKTPTVDLPTISLLTRTPARIMQTMLPNTTKQIPKPRRRF